jgi:hypothetical protein
MVGLSEEKVSSMTPLEDTKGLEETYIIYTLIHDDELIVVENVTARVDTATGEQFFSPATVERLQNIVWGKRRPKRTIRTPVYEFAD